MFLRQNRPYLIGLALAAAAYAVVQMFLIDPIRAESEQEVSACRDLLKEINGYYKPGERMLSLPDARQRLDRDLKTLDAARKEVMGIHFGVPPDFLVPQGVEPNLHFDSKLREVVGSAGKAGVQFVGREAGSIGFTQKFLEHKKEDVPLRLRRLAIAARVLEAMKAAGVEKLIGIQHARAFAYGVPEVNVHIETVNMVVTVQAPEKNFVALLYELQRPVRFLAVRGIRVNVTDPTTGVFEATLSVSGLFVAPGALAQQRPDGPPIPFPTDRY